MALVSHVRRVCDYLDYTSVIQLGSTCCEAQEEACEWIYDNGCRDKGFLNSVFYKLYNDLADYIDRSTLTVQERGLDVYGFPSLKARYWNNTSQLFLRIFLLGDVKIDTFRGRMKISTGLCENEHHTGDQGIGEYYKEKGMKPLRPLLNLILRRLKSSAWNNLVEAWYFTPSMLDCFKLVFESETVCNVCLHEHETSRKICPRCLSDDTICGTCRFYSVKACAHCLSRIRVHRLTRATNDLKRRRVMMTRRWNCPLGNSDCELYGHEGQGCECWCHTDFALEDSYPVFCDEKCDYPPTDESETETE